MSSISRSWKSSFDARKGSPASSVFADREREDQILDLQALSRESLLASFRESLGEFEFDLCSQV